MATRESVEELLQRCEETIRFANEQYTIGSTQEHYNDEQYFEALQQLEETYSDLTRMVHSANSQQREDLNRMRLRLQQLQNQMILLQR